MSDVSGLAQEYTNASHLSAALNRSLVLLKKRQFRLPGAEDIKPADLDVARTTLATIVQIITLLLKDPDAPGTAEPSLSASTRVPPSFVYRLRENWRGELAWRLQDLDEIRTNLMQAQEPQLSHEAIGRLDELARVAEAETSKVFRLMMRSK
jgi:hypothetical protein